MANPHTPGTEKFKLYAYSLAKGNGDKASALFTDTHFGKGIYDVSGGTAIPKVGLPFGSTAHSAVR